MIKLVDIINIAYESLEKQHLPKILRNLHEALSKIGGKKLRPRTPMKKTNPKIGSIMKKSKGIKKKKVPIKTPSFKKPKTLKSKEAHKKKLEKDKIKSMKKSKKKLLDTPSESSYEGSDWMDVEEDNKEEKEEDKKEEEVENKMEEEIKAREENTDSSDDFEVVETMYQLAGIRLNQTNI